MKLFHKILAQYELVSYICNTKGQTKVKQK